jgi:hypothetical protein
LEKLFVSTTVQLIWPIKVVHSERKKISPRIKKFKYEIRVASRFKWNGGPLDKSIKIFTKTQTLVI